MSKAVNSKWKKTFPDTIGNQNRPATGVDDTQPFETGAFPQYMANDPVRYDLQNAAMSQSMSNDARLKEMVDARGKELDDHKVDPGAHKTGIAGNAATATKVVTTAAAGASANIAEATMASNDLARIRVSGETNAGELALETADDGSEPIVARQYTGIYTTPVRTAKILDESGNTSFPGTVVAPKFTGALNGNSATATKLQTPRTLSLTGKAAGSTTFDGSSNASINVTSVNADSASKLSTARKINITGNATGSAGFDGTSDVNINVMVNSATKATNDGNGANIANTYLKKSGGTMFGALNFANATWNLVGDDSYIGDHNIGGTFCVKGASGETGIALVNKGNENDYARISYDGGNINFNKTIGGNLAGNADSATNAANANRLSPESGNNYLSIGTTTDRWSVIGSNPGNWLKSIRTNNSAPPYSIGNFSAAIAFGGGDTKGIITHAYGGPDVKFAGGNGSTANWKFTIRGGYSNEYYDLNNFPTKTGGGASGTWGINISGNADTVDGYHASDLLRTLGGNRTPVITDIFDRAGTIDMSTMSAADKATHKANINKASNMTQNIWNNGRDIHAYGGDTKMNGYNNGTLKLTQSYKNFDKLMIVYTDDDGECGEVRMFDVYEFNYCMTNMHSFDIFSDHDRYWTIYGLTKRGNDSGFKPSTETVLSCRDQNSGLIAIYGIKF